MNLYFRFVSNYTPPSEIYTLSLHDALPILDCDGVDVITHELIGNVITIGRAPSNDVVIDDPTVSAQHGDRKSTRLNSSHRTISYAVFCLKKKHYPQKLEVLLEDKRYLSMPR